VIFTTPLDYTLVSQIFQELEPSAQIDSVYNYYKLNKNNLNQLNEYLYFSDSERLRLKAKSKSMFEFAYDNYIKYAFPLDELDPIHCKGRGPDNDNPSNININDSLGGYLLTLVESLSTLIVVGNSTEFKRASKLVIDHLNFYQNNTVQVFESTIRYIR